MKQKALLDYVTEWGREYGRQMQAATDPVQKAELNGQFLAFRHIESILTSDSICRIHVLIYPGNHRIGI